MSPFFKDVYDFESLKNQHYIKTVKLYDEAFATGDLKHLEQSERNTLDGANSYQIGVNVTSPWGDNKVIEAYIGEFGKNNDIVKKEITIKSGFMLSLQRHRGRQELWEVTKGTLTVISNGKRVEIKTGGNLSLPKEGVHCMANLSDKPVTIIETQTGTCREADNIRLLDFNNRPTIPLSSKNEALSAIIYTQIHLEIERKFGCETKPNMVLLSTNFKKIIENIG